MVAFAARVGRNAEGYRVGESHHRAKLSNATVQRVHELHEQQGLGWRRISRLLKLNAHTVRDILRFHCRGQVAVQWDPIEGEGRRWR